MNETCNVQGTPAVAVQRLVRHLPVRTTFINDDGDLCTISITDPCVVINLYGDRPLVEIFAGTGERTDCEQFASWADVRTGTHACKKWRQTQDA